MWKRGTQEYTHPMKNGPLTWTSGESHGYPFVWGSSLTERVLAKLDIALKKNVTYTKTIILVEATSIWQNQKIQNIALHQPL